MARALGVGGADNMQLLNWGGGAREKEIFSFKVAMTEFEIETN